MNTHVHAHMHLVCLGNVSPLIINHSNYRDRKENILTWVLYLWSILMLSMSFCLGRMQRLASGSLWDLMDIKWMKSFHVLNSALTK